MARRDTVDDGGALDPALAQKKRARRRLVGALVLGLLAAVVLPLILDSEPRQTITDVQIEIPPRDAPLPPKAAVESVPGDASAPPATPATEAGLPAPESAQRAGSDSDAARRPEPAKPADAGKPAGSAKPPKSTDTARSAGAAKSADAAKAPAPSKTPHASADGGRFALQVGAYASPGSARAQADKARQAGVRVYTETVQTAQGERTRVRVGPFPTRDAADEARARLKLIGVDSAVVAL